MKIIIKKQGVFLITVAFLLFQFLIFPASAVLEVTFSESLPINRIQYYWGGEGTPATDNGRIINPDPAISFDLTDPNRQAKPKSSPPTDVYIFGSDSTIPASETTRIRVWNDTRQSDNAKYTALAGYSNPAGTGVFPSLTISYVYIKAAPERAEIYQVDETSSLTLPDTRTGKLKIYSRMKARSDGLSVERKACQWEVTYNGSPLDMSGKTGTQLELTTPTYTFDPGDVYRVRVRYQNLWNAWGEWSDWYDHSIGGMGAAGPETITITLMKPTDDLGINPFSFPFATLTDPAGVTNLKQLIEAVNTEAGENVVTVAGWWNKEAQEPRGYIITYSSAALNDFGTFTTAGEIPADPSGVALEKDMAYQFSVLRPVSMDATGTR